MKKILSVLALSAVIFAGNAMTAADNAEAYFEDGSLWRVVYDDALNVEVVTDLGNTNTLLAAGSVTVTDAWTLNMFPSGTEYRTLNVAYFASDPDNDDAWVSGAAGGQRSGNRKKNAFQNGVGVVQSLYAPEGSVTVEGSLGLEERTYYFSLNNNGCGIGTFNAFLPSPNGSEAKLGDLADIGYVEQYLYRWDENLNTAQDGELVASIRTWADGSTTISSTSSVPVPATVLLFGSGLLGLMGVRRRSGK